MRQVRPERNTMPFEIGAVRASLTTPIRGQRRRYDGLYRDFSRSQPDPESIRIGVRWSALTLRDRPGP